MDGGLGERPYTCNPPLDTGAIAGILSLDMRSSSDKASRYYYFYFRGLVKAGQVLVRET